jgi:ABC-type Fe3+ transport system substrate-binding protein
MRIAAFLLTAAALVLSACQPTGGSTTRPTGDPLSAAPAQGGRAGPSADGSALSPEVQRLIQAARDSGDTELNLSWSLASLGGPEATKRYEALMNQMYGTSVKLNLTPGVSQTDMAAKIAQEYAAGQKAFSDVYLGLEGNILSLLRHDALEDYDYTLLSPRITPEIVAPRNAAVQVYSSISAILYNTDLVAPADLPRTLEDVLHPKWKGRIASVESATAFERVAQRPEWGAERMKAYVARLSSQVGGLIRTSDENRIISGEFPLFVMANTHSARLHQRKGAPLGYVIPQDGAVAVFAHLGVPRHSAHPNLGKLFINAVVSEEGQRILWETYASDHHLLPGSRSGEELADLQARGAGIFPVDVQLLMDRPEMAQLRVELERILAQGRAG